MDRTVKNRAVKKIVITGILVLVAGVLVEGLASWLIGLVFESAGQNREAGAWLLSLIVRVIQIGLAPLGAALVAIGIALRWLPEQAPAQARAEPGPAAQS